MIILITYKDEIDNIIRVSHGYDTNTDKIVILPNDPLGYFNPKWYKGEWVLI